MIKFEEIKCDLEIVEFDDNNGLTLNKKNDNIKVTIYDQEIIENIIETNFNKKYRSLLYLVMNLKNEDDVNPSDCELALVKINDLRTLLLVKYFGFISKELLDKYLNMLMLLEQKVPFINKERGR